MIHYGKAHDPRSTRDTSYYITLLDRPVPSLACQPCQFQVRCRSSVCSSLSTRLSNQIAKTRCSDTVRTSLFITFVPHSTETSLYTVLDYTIDTMNARCLAQEAVSWYFQHADPYAPHAENVQLFLRGPVQAITLSILRKSRPAAAAAAIDTVSTTGAGAAVQNQSNETHATKEESPEEETKATKAATVTAATTTGTWRDYLHSSADNKEGLLSTDWSGEADPAIIMNALSSRTRARLEAFLTAVTLAVPPTLLLSPTASTNTSPVHNKSKKENRLPSVPRPAAREDRSLSFSLVEGLAGFSSFDTRASPVLSSLNARGKNLLRSISSQSANSKAKCPQIPLEELVTRLELYIRSLHRVKAQHQECVLAAEPARAVKARARAVVVAFVDTVGTVRQQSPVLTRLLRCLTQELLAVSVLGENLVQLIRRIVSDYEHKTSFASLAFLSSPENSADQGLTPLVMKYLRYLQQNWKLCESECELELILSRTLGPQVRHLFKTIEFRSIGHLLEVCQGLRSELQRIEIPPNVHGDDHLYDTGNEDAIQQAIRDLQREVITVNGNVLPPVRSRKELLHLLSQTLNSRTLASGPPIKTIRRRKSKTKQSSVRRSESAPNISSASTSQSESEDCSSGSEADISLMDPNLPGGSVSASQRAARYKRRGSFRLSTIDLLTRRLLLAAGRTGTGGDAYFVVRDLFGGDGVEVVPSQTLPMHVRAGRPGTIEIMVRLASVTIKCHGSFDVYPKSLLGDCEPLIQVHTTMTETITLQEVRRSDSSSDDGVIDDQCNSSEELGLTPAVMVLQERKTEKTGWRTLSIRPALYEKVEVWNTPS